MGKIKSAKRNPIPSRSELTGKYYAVTKYEDLGAGRMRAIEKREITKDEYDNLLGATK